MNKLEQLLKETDFTQEEWNIYQKVDKNCRLHDLESYLNVLLEDGDITKEQYEDACENAEYILDKQDDYLDWARDGDWQIALQNAIDDCIEE